VVPGRAGPESFHRAYQSECGDHLLHERHWVSVHWCRHAGHTPPVSKVFHSLPQVQNHLSSLRGVQTQSGHRIREPEESWVLSCSTSRSKTTDDLATSFEKEHVPVLGLNFGSQVVTESLSRRSRHDLNRCDRVNLPSGRSPIALATRSRVLGFILVLHVEQHPTSDLDPAAQQLVTQCPR